MLYAVFSDIQGNFEPVAHFFRETQATAERYLCLGDIVQDGTSFDENRIIELLRSNEVISVQGNHDASVAKKRDDAIQKIHSHNIDYLAGLPVTREVNGFHLVHAPGGIRIFDENHARQGFSFLPPEIKIGFYGHSHQPAVYRKDATGRVHSELREGQMRLDEKSRYLINPGGIGLWWGAPHTYMMYDSDRRMLELKRLNEQHEERR